MSQSVNDQLIEEAREVAESYTGTAVEETILNNLERGDMDKVRQLVKEVKDQWFYEATHPYERNGNYER